MKYCDINQNYVKILLYQQYTYNDSKLNNLKLKIMSLSSYLQSENSQQFYFCFRVFVLIMTGVAIAWVPVVKETQGGQVTNHKDVWFTNTNPDKISQS